MRIPNPDVGPEISRRLLKEFSWHSHECARRARPYLRPILVRLHVTSPWRLAQKAGKTCARIIPTQAATSPPSRQVAPTTHTNFWPATKFDLGPMDVRGKVPRNSARRV